MSLSKLTETESQVLLVGNFNPNFEEWEDVRPATSEEAQLGLVQCEQCEGRGSWPFPTHQVCPACGGKRAIRVKAWLVEPCTTCMDVTNPGHRPMFCPGTEQPGVKCHPCTDCAGSGEVPSEQAIEVVAVALHDFTWSTKRAWDSMNDSEQATQRARAKAVGLALLKENTK